MVKTAEEIRSIVERETGWLLSLPPEVTVARANAQGRTIRQILGHLVDSAGNNHQRIVRLQYNDPLEFPDYTQHNDLWISLQDYGSVPWEELVLLWKYYMRHIAHIISRIREDALENAWADFTGATVTLRAMAEGYASHLELHLAEIHELAG